MKRLENLVHRLLVNIKKDNTDEIEKTVNILQENVNLPIKYMEENERDALTEATHNNKIKIVNYLINNKANVNFHVNKGKYSALTEAISHKNVEILKLLLKTANSNTKQTALDYCIENNSEMGKIIADSIISDHKDFFDFIGTMGNSTDLTE